MKLEEIIRKETRGGMFPELGVKIKVTDLLSLGRHYISKFEEQMAKEDDETKLLILQSQYNFVYEFFGKYLTNEND